MPGGRDVLTSLLLRIKRIKTDGNLEAGKLQTAGDYARC